MILSSGRSTRDRELFEAPYFTIWNVLYTGIGATILWGKLGNTKLRPFGLWRLIKLLPVSQNKKEVIEIIVFISLGCIVGIGIVQPTNVPQALSAGFGWTGFLTSNVEKP